MEDLLPWYRRVQLLAPGFVRELERFSTTWVRLWVPGLHGSAGVQQRAYTVVDPDPQAGTFALEFVLHQPAGPAAR